MKHNFTWDIDKNLIPNYQKDSDIPDVFSVTDDNKYGVLIYNIKELSMDSYYGLFAIYSQSHPKAPLINYYLDKRAIHYDCKNSFTYAPSSDCFMFVHAAYKQNSMKPSMPYLFVNPKKQQFSFLDWDYTSFYYGFKEISKDILQLYATYPLELDSRQFRNRTGEHVNLNDLTWYDIKYLSKAYVIYHS